MYLLLITSKLLCGCYGNQKRRSYEKISLNLDQLWKTWGFVSLLISFYWKSILNQHLFVQRQQWQQQHDVWNRFKVNNKDNRKTPLTPTAKNTVIWPNLLLCKFCAKAQFPHSFGRFALNYAETVPFHKICTSGN